MQTRIIVLVSLTLSLLFAAGCSTKPSSYYKLKFGDNEVTITAVKHDLLHIRYSSRQGPDFPERSWAVPQQTEPAGFFRVSKSDSVIELHTGSLIVHLNRDDGRISVYDKQRNLLSEDVGLSLAPDTLKLTRHLFQDENIYGFGESTGPLRKNGRSYTMWNTDVLGTGSFDVDEDPLYQSFPIYLSLHDGNVSGFFLNNTRKSHFDVGESDPGLLQVDVAGGPLDYYFFSGEEVGDVVEDLTWLTGRAPLPPLWSLGYHQCRWGYMSAGEILDIAHKLRERHIPADAMWLDIDYMDRFRIFTWNPDSFATPKALTTELDSLGFHTVTIIDPGVHAAPNDGYSVYDEGIEKGYFVTNTNGDPFVGEVWPGPAVFPDFTNPMVRDWWAGMVADWMGYGIDGIWVDMNEPATWKPKGGFPLDTRWNGEGIATDHRETHNVYASLMSQATREGIKRAFPKKRPFVLTRAGFPGIQRYAATWNGDVPGTWEHYEGTAPMLMSMGLSGNAFVGSDLGGFTGGEDPELFIRWVQLGAWTPFFRNHANKDAQRGEPWAYGPLVEKLVRDAIEQRYRHLPLWQSLFHEHLTTGAPIMRPLFFDPQFRLDDSVLDISDQFLVGSQIMVTPTTKPGATARPVYFPEGTWTEISTDKHFAGPGRFMVRAGIDNIPRFARENAIIPTWPLMQYVGEFTPDSLILDLYPVEGAPEGCFTLYEDDGIHRDSPQRYCDFRLMMTSTGISLDEASVTSDEYQAMEKQLLLRFHGIQSQPVAVNEGSHADELLPLPSSGNHPAGVGEWKFDNEKNLLELALSHDIGNRSIRIIFE